MKLVRPGVFIGSMADSRNFESLQAASITHILSLVPFESAGDEYPVTRKVVSLLDAEDENLLDVLPGCLAFMKEARASYSSLLVHCLAGISRSAAVIVAYLMSEEGLSVHDALASLQEASPTAFPNLGFLEQLALFERMGCRLDSTNAEYKQHRLLHLGRACLEGSSIESSSLAEDPMDLDGREQKPPNASSSGAAMAAVGMSRTVRAVVGEMLTREVTMYRCRKCRRALAAAANVLPHAPGSGASSFAWHKRGGGAGAKKAAPEEEASCSSVFVEPMRWMSAVQDGEVVGKLLCPSCNSRLGTFNWSGEQCSCGAWVTPSFQLHKSRMDASWQ